MSVGSHYSFQEVLPNLCIGSQFALLYPKLLHKAGVTHLLSLNNFTEIPSGFQAKVLDVHDEEDENITEYFQEAFSFINSSDKCLVFCTAGRSRSATVVLAYLIYTYKLKLSEAFAKVSKVREVRPNKGFLKQLQKWESTCSCELCAMDKVTHWYEETPNYVVCICDQCELPMAVYRKHETQVPSEVEAAMLKALSKAASEFFEGKWYVDTKPRTIMDHAHWHARPTFPKL